MHTRKRYQNKTAMEQFVIREVLPYLHCDAAHSIDHFLAVRDHAILAVDQASGFLTDEQKEAVIAAAFLHDVDDYKLTKGHTPLYHDTWLEYVIEELKIPNGESITKMVELVSCSKWGDHKDDTSPDYYYIPRYCDRLEAIGEIGVKRCIEFSESRQRPFHLPETSIVTTREDLYKVATPERYDLYSRGIKRYPETILDHFYDKLLHIKLPVWMSNNQYLRTEFDKRTGYVEDWVINYWKN
jgi:uncharacterized protein